MQLPQAITSRSLTQSVWDAAPEAGAFIAPQVIPRCHQGREPQGQEHKKEGRLQSKSDRGSKLRPAI